MAETEFKVFAQKLATYFQGDLSPEEFTRTLFKKFYLNPNGDTLLYDMKPRTLRGYFYEEHKENLVYQLQYRRSLWTKLLTFSAKSIY